MFSSSWLCITNFNFTAEWRYAATDNKRDLPIGFETRWQCMQFSWGRQVEITNKIFVLYDSSFLFSLIGGSDYKLIYRHYATLYFVFCVDSSESELGILDLIQVFVETLDKCFENVCELDLIFHVDKVHYILNELVMGGMVLETNMTEILTRIEDQNKLEKQEVLIHKKLIIYISLTSIFHLFKAGIAAAPARAVSAVKNMNIPQQIKDIKLPDLPQAIKDLKFWPIMSSEFENIDIASLHFPADCSSLLHKPTTAKYTWCSANRVDFIILLCISVINGSFNILILSKYNFM